MNILTNTTDTIPTNHDEKDILYSALTTFSK